jgi:hypothetical protein
MYLCDIHIDIHKNTKKFLLSTISYTFCNINIKKIDHLKRIYYKSILTKEIFP